MKLYLLKRILFSIFAFVVVVMVIMLLIYSLIDSRVIFQTDDVWNKRSGNDRTLYEYKQWTKYGYVVYEDYSNFLSQKYIALVGEDYSNDPQYFKDKNVLKKKDEVYENESVKEFIALYESKGYTILYMEPQLNKNGSTKTGGNPYLIAYLNKSPFIRVLEYFGNLFSVETTNQVKDPNLTDRYIRFEKDPYSGLFAIVGSGTQHKYLLYFDGRFPFIHQNFIHLNLGVSYSQYRGEEISSVLTTPRGDMKKTLQQYPKQIGTDVYEETSVDFHTLTYNAGTLSEYETSRFYDNYTNAKYTFDGFSMLENSFVIGIIATIIEYMIGLPLGILMARNKDGIVDQVGKAYIIFIMAVPSLAYIFMFSVIGTTLFGLPYKFANATAPVLGYFLPVISLALPGIGGLMKWMRRYMIDQMNSDYVKFARSQGLSEREIYSVHISRNAMIYIVHGIPGSILGCLVGVLITERVYAVPGVGNLLTNALNSHDNGVIVAATVFYTTLSLLSVILGDLLLIKYDPRISLSTSRGGGR